MREAKKILSAIQAHYPSEVSVFESMPKHTRKSYAGYVLRKGDEFLSPSAWLDKNAFVSFKHIAKCIGCTQKQAIEAYNSGMAKIKTILEQREEFEMFDTAHTRTAGNEREPSPKQSGEAGLLNVSDYVAFVRAKKSQSIKAGFECKDEWLNANLFDYQRDILRRACEIGRYALFMDTGLGKSITQLNFGYCVYKHTGQSVLILAPLSVVYQMLKEARKFGFMLKRVENGILQEGLNITNYEQLGNVKGIENLGGVILDESSILKNYTGKIKNALIETFANVPYRLACSATPSPNDYLELGNHSEFLGVMPSFEMVMRFFINDSMNAGGYRLKKHGEAAFWEWVASWAECISSPSDLGFDGSAFVLPPLNERLHLVEHDHLEYFTKSNAQNALFSIPETNATTLAKNKKQSLSARLEKLIEILKEPNALPHLVWVDTNLEADEVKSALKAAFNSKQSSEAERKSNNANAMSCPPQNPHEAEMSAPRRALGAEAGLTPHEAGLNIVEVRGNDSDEFKAKALSDFGEGRIDILITKSSIAGMGLNYQNACNMSFLGLNYSYESYYQAVRRMYRFGQKSPVNVNVIVCDSESEILQSLHRKKQAHDKMKEGMTKAICQAKSHNELKDTWLTSFKIPSFIKTH